MGNEEPFLKEIKLSLINLTYGVKLFTHSELWFCVLCLSFYKFQRDLSSLTSSGLTTLQI